MVVQKTDNPALSQFGLIGCGQIGSLYDEGKIGDVLSVASAINANSATILKAVCDSDMERANACAKSRGNAKSYGDMDEMFAENSFDAVAICTPPNVRLKAIEAALKAGVKIIWCEKPLAESMSEAKKIKALLSKPEYDYVSFAVNYLRRWLPSTAHIKQIIDSKSLGKTRSARLTYGKGIANNASHFIDLMNFFYGQASDISVDSAINDGRTDDPTLNAHINYAHDGEKFSFDLQGTNFNDHNICELDIILELGRIKLLEGGNLIEIYKASPSELGNYTSLALAEKYENAATGSLTLALDQILETANDPKQKPLCGLKHGIEALEVVEKAMAEYKKCGGGYEQ